jgi:hypothetical protein
MCIQGLGHFSLIFLFREIYPFIKDRLFYVYTKKGIKLSLVLKWQVKTLKISKQTRYARIFMFVFLLLLCY